MMIVWFANKEQMEQQCRESEWIKKQVEKGNFYIEGSDKDLRDFINAK